jgi:hypothetical protein
MKRRPNTNKCIVLDVDSTLVYSDEDILTYKTLDIDRKRNGYDLKSRTYLINLFDIGEEPGSGTQSKMWGVFRPHYFEFAMFIASYFDKVAIWSAGQYQYVHSMCDILFPDAFLQPDVILTRPDCSLGSDKNFYKPLSKIFDMNLGFTPENTFVVDDRAETFSKNPQNGILIPDYSPRADKHMNEIEIMTDDVSLCQLMSWLSLDSVAKIPDVRSLDKSNIFTTHLDTYKQLLERENSNSTQHTVVHSGSRGDTNIGLPILSLKYEQPNLLDNPNDYHNIINKLLGISNLTYDYRPKEAQNSPTQSFNEEISSYQQNVGYSSLPEASAPEISIISA